MAENNLVEQLLRDYSSSTPEIEVVLPKGEVFKFRAIGTFEELQKVKSDALRFHKTLQNDKLCSAKLKEVRSKDQYTNVAVFLLASSIIEPKLTQHDFLTMAKKAPFLLEFLINEVNAKQTKYVEEADEEYLDELKNE